MSNYYKLLEPYYINGAVRPAGDVVTFNDDPKKGGMTPGRGMVPCDEQGNEVKRRGGRAATNADDIG